MTKTRENADYPNREFLDLEASAGNQTVNSTGETTFKGKVTTEKLLETGGGIEISGGNPDNIVNGIVYNDRLRFIVQDEEALAVRTVGNFGMNINQTVNSARTTSDFTSCQTNVVIGDHGTKNVKNFRGKLDVTDATAKDVVLFETFATGNPTSIDTVTNFLASSSTAKGSISYGFRSQLNDSADFNFFASGGSPNFFKGNIYIGGTASRNTFDLWKSTLTEEQLEQLEAGTLAAPANVSTPGDGTFARAWYYDQQDEETQLALDSGELEYPTHLAAATFTDTFDLGSNTKINLNSDGTAKFTGTVELETSVPQFRMVNTQGAVDNKGFLFRNTDSGAKLQILAITDAGSAGGQSVSFIRTGNNINSFNCNKDGNPWFTCDNDKKEVITDGLGEFKGGVLVSKGAESKFTGTVELATTVPQFRMVNTQGTTNNKGFLFRNAGSGARLQILAIDDAGSAGGQSVSFERTGNNIDSFNCNKDGNPWFTCDNNNKEVTVNGEVIGQFSLRMQTDDPAAFQTTYAIDDEGNQVESQTYTGTTEDLLSIIKDLRARVTALENA